MDGALSARENFRRRNTHRRPTVALVGGPEDPTQRDGIADNRGVNDIVVAATVEGEQNAAGICVTCQPSVYGPPGLTSIVTAVHSRTAATPKATLHACIEAVGIGRIAD